MKIKIYMFLGLMLFFIIGESQNVNSKKMNDLTVVIHQNTLNKLIQTIGLISGTGTYEVMFIKGNYRWFLENTKINLIKDSAIFESDVKVESGIDVHKDHVKGIMSVNYNQQTNQILIKLLDAVFHLKVNVLGKEFTIKKIQIADYINEPFVFEGPQLPDKPTEFTLPDGTVKKVFSKLEKQELKILPQEIRLTGDIRFFEKKEIPLSNPSTPVKQDSIKGKN